MQVEVGLMCEGRVTGLTKFGAFVELPGGNTGMVHISEVASSYVKEITQFLSEGQTVKVMVIGIGDDGKISLSIKKAIEKERPAEDTSAKPKRPYRSSSPNVWQGKRQEPDKDMSFEDMMQKFKQVSDEKMTDLKHSKESKYGGGFSRRGGAANRK
ncbi:MAG: S1 RNA-binding domain-containing protein [Oscillospiraceae bacterium]|jgi:S1 RNA binding domain protein|nr:S1 RNA-binding domain-containing protein [Oscillospiraceae bacterium]